MHFYCMLKKKICIKYYIGKYRALTDVLSTIYNYKALIFNGKASK